MYISNSLISRCVQPIRADVNICAQSAGAAPLTRDNLTGNVSIHVNAIRCSSSSSGISAEQLYRVIPCHRFRALSQSRYLYIYLFIKIKYIYI